MARPFATENDELVIAYIARAHAAGVHPGTRLIARCTGLGRGAVRMAIRRLSRAGRLTRVQRGGRGRPDRYAVDYASKGSGASR